MLPKNVVTQTETARHNFVEFARAKRWEQMSAFYEVEESKKCLCQIHHLHHKNETLSRMRKVTDNYGVRYSAMVLCT